MELLWEFNELARVKLTAGTTNNTGVWCQLFVGRWDRFLTGSLSDV